MKSTRVYVYQKMFAIHLHILSKHIPENTFRIFQVNVSLLRYFIIMFKKKNTRRIRISRFFQIKIDLLKKENKTKQKENKNKTKQKRNKTKRNKTKHNKLGLMFI